MHFLVVFLEDLEVAFLVAHFGLVIFLEVLAFVEYEGLFGLVLLFVDFELLIDLILKGLVFVGEKLLLPGELFLLLFLLPPACKVLLGKLFVSPL